MDKFKAPFIARIRERVGDDVQLRPARCYIGDSPRRGMLRLYASADLASFIEVEEKAIVHVEPVKDSGLGAVTVWLLAEAKVEVTGRKASIADFMRGQLTRDISDLVPVSRVTGLKDTPIGPPTSGAMLSPYFAGTLPGLTPIGL
ncbi:hypothetical protein D3P06_12965 [Paracoccus aestuarii]|uniref:Uncharacterized protein n=1 Tax=Paracoccus aestuarii TaxID=453842 RepID=A0A418ZSW0_9RHOB|nr:hypothetical protein [Paracoccus aestuarii]RJL00915.1 hypothetical protein D3P06_12965 [Paracoccus aestuarii]WCR00981.1 hypothetical protein JHW48_15675 [Paracoccus aestuarii]